MSLRFTVPGEPFAWQRVQERGRKKFNSTEMTAAKETIAQYASLAIREAHGVGSYPKACKFWLDCTFFIGSNRRANPDIDNLLKTVADALNGLVWYDDRQIVGLKAHKLLSPRAAATDVIILDESDLRL